jgi:hypothetical protein
MIDVGWLWVVAMLAVVGGAAALITVLYRMTGRPKPPEDLPPDDLPPAARPPGSGSP